MAIKYLYIDDDHEDQKIFSLAAVQLDEDVDVISLDDGRALLDLLTTDPTLVPDFIFLDLEMPKMDGFEILKALKKIPRLQQTDIIIYSDFIVSKYEYDVELLGAKVAVKKFFSMEDLKDFLSQLNIAKLASSSTAG